MHDLGCPFRHHIASYGNAAKFRNLTDIVSSEVNEHRMFCSFFRVCQQIGFILHIFFSGLAPWLCSGNWTVVNRTILYACQHFRRSSGNIISWCMEIIEIRGWIADPQFPVNIKAIRRILDFKPLGKNNLENITVHNVFLCLPNDVHIGILARVGMYDGSSCFQGWLWCWVISANLLCQFFRSPESCCILGIQVAICVQILNYNPVVFQVVIGNQFFIQKQIAVWHVNVIFRNIHQCFFQIPHGIISEIANQSACEIRCIRQNRSGILCHSFFQEQNGVFHHECFLLVVFQNASRCAVHLNFLFRICSDKGIPSPLFAVVHTLENKGIFCSLRHCPIQVDWGLIVRREIIENGNGIILFGKLFHLFQ